MYQKLSILGNLGKDPEMRYTPTGVAVTTLNVATNRTWTNQDGQKVKATTWFKVSVWNKMAEVCNEWLHKGQKVFIEGYLESDPKTGGPKLWSRQDGTTGATFEVRALNVIFLGGNGATDDEPRGDVPEEDIPF